MILRIDTSESMNELVSALLCEEYPFEARKCGYSWFVRIDDTFEYVNGGISTRRSSEARKKWEEWEKTKETFVFE